MAYAHRNDIDGLRALAITPVLLLHSGSSLFSGGYIGVDIFFVISGFLITSIIFKEIQEGKFTILKFYERRARRIFPALTIVFVFCVIASHLTLLPLEYKDFGQSLLSSTLFVSNILFWIEAGYFDAESLTKPLLHTWSLSVEEQFYILFPPLLLLLTRFTRRWILWALACSWALSFISNVFLVHTDQSAAFFLSPGRAWELLTGAILALNSRHSNNRILNEILSTTGFILILFSIFIFDSSTLFPGYPAVLPCLGTALIIYSGSKTTPTISKLLSLRPIVFIGLISYSLYLWHWPIFVFTHVYLDKPFTPALSLMLISVTTVLAWLSWRYVESPFRGRSSKVTRKMVFQLSVPVALVFISIGATLQLTDGMPLRLSNTAIIIARTIQVQHSFLPKGCLKKGGTTNINEVSPCIVRGKDFKQNAFLVWGDSHAAAYMPGISGSLPSTAKVKAEFTGMQGCPPLIGITTASSEKAVYSRCAEYNQRVLNHIKSDPGIKLVVLSAFWSLYTNGERLASDPNHGDVYLYDTSTGEISQSPDKNRSLLEKGLIATISELTRNGRAVLIVGPFPELDFDGASTLARNDLFHLNRDIRPTMKDVEKRSKSFLSILNRITKKYPIKVSLPHLALCRNSYCEVMADNKPIYIDRHHLSIFGANYVARSTNIQTQIISNL